MNERNSRCERTGTRLGKRREVGRVGYLNLGKALELNGKTWKKIRIKCMVVLQNEIKNVLEGNQELG